MSKITTVQLIGMPKHPLLTIGLLWMASRTEHAINYAQACHEYETNEQWRNSVDVQAMDILLDDIPVAENLDFVFLLENVPISLREQMVRSRIGHMFGENFGVDTLPYPQGSGPSFWSQTMRIKDMRNFATDGEYFCPESIRKTLPGDYAEIMSRIADVYDKMLAHGISPEDARQVLPMAACSRISWKMNFQAIKGLLKKRGCWIAQLGMWEPVVRGIVSELCHHVHPSFSRLITPPCMEAKSNKFKECPYLYDAEKRYTDEDPEPPCSLHLYHIQADCDAGVVCQEIGKLPAQKQAKLEQLRSRFSRLWNRNSYTGEYLG